MSRSFLGRGPLSMKFSVVALIIALLQLGFALVISHRDAPLPSPVDALQATGRPVRWRIESIPLVEKTGLAVDLAALHGLIVVPAGVMTSCQEERPITMVR